MITSAVPFSQEFQKYTQFDGFNEFLKDLRESIIKKNNSSVQVSALSCMKVTFFT